MEENDIKVVSTKSVTMWSGLKWHWIAIHVIDTETKFHESYEMS
jgi:hypothetical protein